MMHRLILMLSGLLMMFAIFGLVMWIGAEVGENDDAASGNMILFLIMTTADRTVDAFADE
jgi:type IV secretory pathway TrbD component